MTQISLSPRAARRTGALALAGLTLIAAGCGSSSTSSNAFAGSTDGVPNGIPSGEATTASKISSAEIAAATKAAAAAAASTSSTSTTPATPPPTVPTPKTGPLSKEPAIAKGKGPAPKTLVVKNLIVGKGAVAVAGKTLTVNYVGALYSNGTVFDASWKRNMTFPFTLGEGQVIKGWDQGLAGMKVGGRRELTIPSALAYGAAGSPPTIPANAPLIFIVDLLKVS
jgi:peptidylprolyl isomerase